MTLAEIRSRVRERLDEGAGSSSLRYTTALIDQYALDGARFYVARTGCQYATHRVTGVAYQLLYDLPCDFVHCERVLWITNGKYEPVIPTQPRTLDDRIWKWQRQTGPRATNYFIFVPRKIGLWPVPTTSGEGYIVHYQQDVSDDLTAVPVEEHEALVDYAIGRMMLSEGKAKGAQYYSKYKAVVEGATRRRASLDRHWSMGRG